MSTEQDLPADAATTDLPEVPRTDREVEELLLGSDSDVRPLLTVVLPTLDEAAGIGACIERIKAAIGDLGVPTEIIVSDSSTDSTPDIARELGAIVVEPDRPGYGYAYRYAFERARGAYVVMGDADCTYDFGEIPRLLEPIVEGDADIVMGSRLRGEIKPGAMPALHRYVGNPLLTRFLNTFYEAGVTDAHSGFRVLTREALQRLDLDSDGMEFASEMVMQAAASGLTIEEVPIRYHPREGEATLDSFQDGWRHVKFMLVNAPSFLFSVPAVALSVVGLLTMTASVVGVELLGLTFSVHTVIAGSLLTIVGYQVGSLAVFSRLTADPIRGPRDPITKWFGEEFKLEHGATLGLALFGAGTAFVAWSVFRWFTSGLTELPFVSSSMLAFTVIVLGVQTVFYSFFLSMVNERAG